LEPSLSHTQRSTVSLSIPAVAWSRYISRTPFTSPFPSPILKLSLFPEQNWYPDTRLYTSFETMPRPKMSSVNSAADLVGWSSAELIRNTATVLSPIRFALNLLFILGDLSLSPPLNNFTRLDLIDKSIEKSSTTDLVLTLIFVSPLKGASPPNKGKLTIASSLELPA